MMWWKTFTFAAVLLQILMTTSTIPLLEKTVSSDIRQETTNYRLPTNVRPIHYKITLEPLIEESSMPTTFNGVVNINVKVTEDTKSITLHHKDIVLKSYSISKVGGGNVVVTQSYDPITHFWKLSVDATVAGQTETTFEKDEEYVITATYTGNHGDDMYGFYRSSYKKDGETVWLLTTQFEPVHARRAFPCFDEPAFRATFEISIKKDGNNKYHAISNMPLKNDDNDHFNFETTPAMPTYLVAFIVSDFESKFKEDYFHVWARDGAIDQAQYSADVGPELLKAIEDFLLDLNYPLPKMDEVAVPDFSAGAMENWGLTTYRERIILYDEGHTNTATKQQITAVAAHELAHQWFGDLVTPEWWNFLWLNEGFATYFEFFATHTVNTKMRMNEQYVIRVVQYALAADALVSSHPMTQAVDSPDSIRSIFDTISYEKAGSVIRMMEHFVTTPVFRQGLKRYLESRSYSSANEEHLYVAMNEEFRTTEPDLYRDVSLVMYSWTRQAGYPLLTVTSEGNELIITQNRFLLSTTTPTPKEDSPLWIIPLTYTAQDDDFSDTSTKEWMRTPSLRISRPAAANNWFIFNVQQTGYYRVNYDKSNWNLLINYLNNNDYKKIHPVNRAQLLDDALNLARAGVLPYGTALELAEYLEKEEDYIPWYSALTAFTFLNLRLRSTDTYEHFKDYLLKLIQPMYEKLQFKEDANDDHMRKLYRSLILQWACNLGHEECIASAKSNFQDLQDGTALLSPDLQSVTYCVALREGGEEEWNYLWDKYTKSNYATEQSLILTALGCTTDQTLIDRYLKSSIEDRDNIRRQDAASVFSAVYSNNPDGFKLAFTFLKDNFDDVATSYGTGVTNIITGIAGRISTQEQFQEFKTFVDQQELGAAQDAATRAVESARENLKWSEIRGSEIRSWLKGERPTTTEETSPPSTSTPEASSTSTSAPEASPPSTSTPEASSTSTSAPEPSPPSTSTSAPEPSPPSTSTPEATTDGASSLSLSPAVCMTLFFICLYQMLSTFKLK